MYILSLCYREKKNLYFKNFINQPDLYLVFLLIFVPVLIVCVVFLLKIIITCTINTLNNIIKTICSNKKIVKS